MILTDPFWVDIFRQIYAALALLCSTGFIATLMLRWDLMVPGRRVLWVGLIMEQLVVTYAAYVAITSGFPPSLISFLLIISLLVMLLGFVLWAHDGLIEARSPAG